MSRTIIENNKIGKLLGGCIKCGKPAGKHQWTKRKGMCAECWREHVSHESLGLINFSEESVKNADS